MKCEEIITYVALEDLRELRHHLVGKTYLVLTYIIKMPSKLLKFACELLSCFSMVRKLYVNMSLVGRNIIMFRLQQSGETLLQNIPLLGKTALWTEATKSSYH